MFNLLNRPCAPKPVSVSLALSPALDQRLTELAASTSHSKEDILKRAIALFDVAHSARNNSQRIGIIGADQKLVSEIVGL